MKVQVEDLRIEDSRDGGVGIGPGMAPGFRLSSPLPLSVQASTGFHDSIPSIYERTRSSSSCSKHVEAKKSSGHSITHSSVMNGALIKYDTSDGLVPETS